MFRFHQQIFQLDPGLGREYLETKFVVGADGAGSTIRKLIFPETRVVCRPTYRECYNGNLSLDPNYFHWFLPLSCLRPRFDVNFKGEYFLLEGALKELKDEILQSLQPYGFSWQMQPLWQDGSLSGARLEGLTGSFIPVRGNILLAGDAALMQLNVSGEGIGTALKSGRLAALSLAEAMSSKDNLDVIYRRHLEPMVNTLQEVNLWRTKIEEASRESPAALLAAFSDGLRATLDLE